jgi:hypothetical protein
MQTTLENLNETLKKLIEALGIKLPGAMSGLGASASAAADDMNRAFGRVKIPDFGGGRFNPPDGTETSPNPSFATGGYVTKPTMALFGEAGPEYALREPQLKSLIREATGTGGGGMKTVNLVTPNGRVLWTWLLNEAASQGLR